MDKIYRSGIGFDVHKLVGNVLWVNATNESGFSALPAGYIDGNHYDVGESACFWSASEYNGFFAYYWYMDATNAFLDDYNKYSGRSVRCFHDSPAPAE